MSKIRLGQQPKTFAPVVVTFPMPDGSKGSIQCTFAYRTRRQFGELVAATFGKEAAAGSDAFDLAKAVAASVSRTGEYLHTVLCAWDIDTRLEFESCVQLADEVPAAATAIVDAYARAVTEGHLGN